MKNKENQKIKFYNNYINNYISAFSPKQLQKISKIESIIENKIIHKKFIFVCGNGGSAAVANHFLCDFNKGIKKSSNKKILPKVLSLSNSVEIITALANDESYEKIFVEQMINYSNSGDCLIVLSCSGKSKNILNIMKYARSKKIFVISLTGFNDSQKVKKLSNINFNVGIKNYGICEDIFQCIMHMISQSIRRNFSTKMHETL